MQEERCFLMPIVGHRGEIPCAVLLPLIFIRHGKCHKEELKLPDPTAFDFHTFTHFKKKSYYLGVMKCYLLHSCLIYSVSK